MVMNLVEYKDFKMLFTGDASANGIKEILDEIPKNITVLKVPHHGAIDGLNREIVGFLNPEYSLISVGENRFGHPAIYILELLKDSKILKTDINNSVFIRVNEKGVKVFTYDIKDRRYR